MRIPNFLINRETVTLCLVFKEALKDLYRGFKNLLICIVLFIILIPLTILDFTLYLISRSKEGK